jgi:hypothetical protein
VDAFPRVRFLAANIANQDGEEPERVRNVNDDYNEADEEEANEAGFGGVAGGDEAGKLEAVGVEAVCQNSWSRALARPW